MSTLSIREQFVNSEDFNHQLSTINHHQPSSTIINHHQPSTINHQPSTINNQQSTINNQQSTNSNSDFQGHWTKY
ncbi:hypothetical protein [Myroides fluvii]|uniref:hypothetical protein n=1 Tax=Myroides fluvii TaxID=2572594 RepID=UPI00131ADE98|nr:hypothetical protein [Myroides fluvii]